MSVHLLRDLEDLHQDLLSMGMAVEGMIHQAVDAISEMSIEKSELLVSKDDEIDRWDVRIEENCLKMLALYQPVATDLRRITTVMKIASELERVADLAVHISERACGLRGEHLISIPTKLKTMARFAIMMLHRSIHSYVQSDSQLARAVCLEDDKIDALNLQIIQELTEKMENSPYTIKQGLHLFSVSRHIERVADHATNIAEDVVYLVEGEIIRHRTNLEKAPEFNSSAFHENSSRNTLPGFED